MPCESQPCPVGCVHNPPAPLLGSPPDMRAACSCRPRSCGNTHLCSCGKMAVPTGPHSDSERTQHVPVQLWPSVRANRIPVALSCQQEPSRIQLIRNTSPVDMWHHARSKRQQDFMRSFPLEPPPAYLQVCKCSHTLHRGRGPRIIGGSCQNLLLVIAISYKLLLLASCYYLLSLVIVYHC